MKAITIHNLDDNLYKAIKDKANEKGLSLNKTVKKLLEKTLGINSENQVNNQEDFKEFLGLWSTKDMKDFKNNIKDTETIDENDWL